MARVGCSGCGVNPAFPKRGQWFFVHVSRPSCGSGSAADEGLKLFCDKCTRRIRAAMVSADTKEPT